MDADDLTQEQLRQVAENARQCVGFYHKLLRRMDERGFSRHGKLYLLTLEAHKAAQSLWLDLHYRSSGSDGVNVYRHPPATEPNNPEPQP